MLGISQRSFVLQGAIDYLMTHGWTKYTFGEHGKPRCLVGALMSAALNTRPIRASDFVNSAYFLDGGSGVRLMGSLDRDTAIFLSRRLREGVNSQTLSALLAAGHDAGPASGMFAARMLEAWNDMECRDKDDALAFLHAALQVSIDLDFAELREEEVIW